MKEGSLLSFVYCLSLLEILFLIKLLFSAYFSWSQRKNPQRDFHVSLFSLSFSITPFPTGANMRLTVYQCIASHHLYNFQPRLSPSPWEGAEDQEKGKESRNEWGGEGKKCAFIPQDRFLSAWIRKWECDGRTEHRHPSSVSVCVRVCLCVCVDLVELRCHICEDHSFTAGGKQGWHSKSLKCQKKKKKKGSTVICRVFVCVCVCDFYVSECLLGHLMEIDTTFRFWKC